MLDVGSTYDQMLCTVSGPLMGAVAHTHTHYVNTKDKASGSKYIGLRSSKHTVTVRNHFLNL